MRLFLAALLVCFTGAVSAFDVPQRFVGQFKNRILTPVEGLWLWNSGALVTITADSRGELLLTLVDSPDPLVEVPKVIGTGRFGGRDGSYNLEFVTDTRGEKTRPLPKKIKMSGSLTSDGKLELTPDRSGLKINLWRLVPYLFRFSVSKGAEPTGYEGAIRVWPVSPNPDMPVVL